MPQDGGQSLPDGSGLCGPPRRQEESPDPVSGLSLSASYLTSTASAVPSGANAWRTFWLSSSV